MNNPQGQNPDSLRIGDAERNAAAEDLGEHFAAGRLTQGEFEERTGAVYQARTEADLKAVLFDLPGGTLDGYLTERAADADRHARAVPAHREDQVDAEHGGEVSAAAEQGITRSQKWAIAKYTVPFISLILFMLMREAEVTLAWLAFLLIPIVWMVASALENGSGSGRDRRERRERREQRRQ